MKKNDAGRYWTERYAESEESLQLLTSAIDDGQLDSGVTLFRLSGPGSPFSEELLLVDAATDGGVTTDYIQFVILVSGSEASEPLGGSSK